MSLGRLAWVAHFRASLNQVFTVLGRVISVLELRRLRR
mgnify:CR=1 FL=1